MTFSVNGTRAALLVLDYGSRIERKCARTSRNVSFASDEQVENSCAEKGHIGAQTS